MRIIVDADACPVKREILSLARPRDVEVVLVVNIHHEMSQYEEATIIVVGDYEDEVDFKIVDLTEPGDIIVTQDVGLAALVLARNGQAVSPRGEVFIHERMPRMLEIRHRNREAMQRGRYPKPQKPFSDKDRKRFTKALQGLLEACQQRNTRE